MRKKKFKNNIHERKPTREAIGNEGGLRVGNELAGGIPPVPQEIIDRENQ